MYRWAVQTLFERPPEPSPASATATSPAVAGSKEQLFFPDLLTGPRRRSPAA